MMFGIHIGGLSPEPGGEPLSKREEEVVAIRSRVHCTASGAHGVVVALFTDQAGGEWAQVELTPSHMRQWYAVSTLERVRRAPTRAVGIDMAHGPDRGAVVERVGDTVVDVRDLIANPPRGFVIERRRIGQEGEATEWLGFNHGCVALVHTSKRERALRFARDVDAFAFASFACQNAAGAELPPGEDHFYYTAALR